MLWAATASCGLDLTVRTSRVASCVSALEYFHPYLPSWRSSDIMEVLVRISFSMPITRENGPDENVDDEPSDPKVVKVGLCICTVVAKDLFEALRDVEVATLPSFSPSLLMPLSTSLLVPYSCSWHTSLREWTTSPIVGRWLHSGATHAAAMVATWMKSSRGYLLTKEGSASSCSLCLSLNRGRAYTSQSKDGNKTQTTLHICFMLKLYTIVDGRKS